MGRRRVLVAALTAALVPAVLAAVDTPSARAAAGRDPIYRLRITLATTSSSEVLYLAGPAVFIVGRSRVLTPRPGVRAAFGGFGGGPVQLLQPRPSKRRWVRARFVVALTPRGIRALRFVSLKGTKGRSVIAINNLNRARPLHIKTVRQRGRRITAAFSVSTRAVAARGPVPGTAPLSPLVLAHYYPWYTLSTWYDTSFAPYNYNDHPYDSGDPAVIQRQIQEARSAGIEGFVSSWWGRGTVTDRNLAILFQQLPAGFDVAVSVNGFAPAFGTVAAWVRQIEYVLHTYGSRPQYLNLEGAPVVYFWATPYVLEPQNGPVNPHYLAVWHSIFRQVRADGYHFRAIGMYVNGTADLAVFDGLRTYVNRYPWTSAWIDRRMELVSRAYAAVHGGHRRIWGSGVFPGYDDRQLARPDPFFLPRNNGALYRSQWEDAIAAGSDQALVATFNEWHETTNIEPNRRWGDLYLRITARWAQAFERSR
jgi:hypothetical protein